MKPLTSILVIASPGQFRDSLLVLLNAIVRMEAIDLVNDGPSVLDKKREDPPALAVIAVEQDRSKLGQILEQMKATWPQTRMVVLVDNEQDQSAAREAGADIVLLKGIRAAILLRRIEELLDQ